MGVIAGVALLTLSPACQDTEQKGLADGDTADAIVENNEVSSVDAIIEDIQQLLDLATEETSVSEEVAGVEDVATVEDSSTPEVVVADAANADVGKDCIESCYQPNGKACMASVDCNLTVPGKCEGTETECTDEIPCADGLLCQGSYVIAANVDPTTGETAGWSPVACLEGECHVGATGTSVAAQECCQQAQPPGCDVFIPGCNPWGPPAPPEFQQALV
ncbi:MAG TPA: hypothetical protein EYN66_24700 [Myxococcales bacterium]|nr:hypothetical protein [Myxococcales bacterium]